MAEVAFTRERYGSHGTVVTWANATNGGSVDTFLPIKLDRTPYSLTLQVTDADAWAAGTGPTVTVQGSLDGSTYFDLEDMQGDAISVTADALNQIGNVPLWLKPVMADGDSGTDVTVVLLVRHDAP